MPTKINSNHIEGQAKILIQKLQQISDNHTAEAIVADHIEMLCLLVKRNGYENLHKGWEGINEKLYEEGVLK